MDIFHRHRQADEQGHAAAALERAMQTAEYRPEALVWKGIAALPHSPELAFVFFSNAAQALPDRADIHALIGRSLLAQGYPALASQYLMVAWRQQPNEPALRVTLWQARSQSESPADLRRHILAHLPDITAPNELALVLKLLADQVDAPSTVGVVRYVPEQKQIHGWAVDLRNLQVPASLQVEAGSVKASMQASAAHPLLSAAGLPGTHGGIRISVPNSTAAVSIRFDSGPALLGSPVCAMPVFVPPAATGDGGERQPVDVLIPVYNGLSETLDCINSALEARKLNSTPHRLVVIEDVTPVPALAKALKVLAAKGKITLLHNPVNLGFIRSMNRAMAVSPNKDVVWLNADTRVHGDWLDRLRKVAYGDSSIASVTPFTNNGELMSFPRSQLSHAMPNAREQAELDDLARQADIPAMEIETGCGFCLYIKRAALDQVGYLDDVHLSRGYGEETDWCLRARGLGWRHMGAPCVFVAHQGGISFGAEKVQRVAHNNAILRQRYPDASTRYKSFCLRDPIKPARDALQRARLNRLIEQVASGNTTPWVGVTHQTLHIHNGTCPSRPFSLIWRSQAQHTWATLNVPLEPLALSLDYALPEDLPDLLTALRALGPSSLIFEHLARCPAALCDLPSQLGAPYRIICRDDRLLRQDGAYDWPRFAQGAIEVQLPWHALKARYAEALPGASLSFDTPRKPVERRVDMPRALLIGDDLSNTDIAKRWLALSRHIIRQQLPVMLLIKNTSPWLKALIATGAVHTMAEVHEFTLAERALACGCEGVLSLDDAPGAGWSAPVLSVDLDVPLYAPASPVADEASALPITFLTFSLSTPDA